MIMAETGQVASVTSYCVTDFRNIAFSTFASIWEERFQKLLFTKCKAILDSYVSEKLVVLESWEMSKQLSWVNKTNNVNHL